MLVRQCARTLLAERGYDIDSEDDYDADDGKCDRTVPCKTVIPVCRMPWLLIGRCKECNASQGG